MANTTSLKKLLYENTIAADPALVRQETDKAVRCLACGHRCLIREGKAGVCRVRFNRDGELRVPGNYVAGLQADPIEKKPFFHAFPGRDALSFGMLGCDLHCSYCQNWVTSQALRDDQAVAMPRFVQAADMVDFAVKEHIPVIVSTYNEPLITADWAGEVFKRAHAEGIACGFVSNGNATPEVLDYLRPFTQLYKVDLKSFRDKEYRKLGCKLDTVLDSIRRLKQMDYWVELVTLVVPDLNDSDEELRDMAAFIAEVSPAIPWHVTAFRPDYKMDGGRRTTTDDLERAYNAGKEAGLQFVYPGNLAGMVGDRENTHCPECGHTVIERNGFLVAANHMRDGKCPECGHAIPGVWEAHPPPRSEGSGFPRPVRI